MMDNVQPLNTTRNVLPDRYDRNHAYTMPHNPNCRSSWLLLLLLIAFMPRHLKVHLAIVINLPRYEKRVDKGSGLVVLKISMLTCKVLRQ